MNNKNRHEFLLKEKIKKVFKMSIIDNESVFLNPTSSYKKYQKYIKKVFVFHVFLNTVLILP